MSSCLAEDSKLYIYHEGKTGGKAWTIKELEGYFSVRAKRGKLLPSGYNGEIRLEEIKALEVENEYLLSRLRGPLKLHCPQ